MGLYIAEGLILSRGRIHNSEHEIEARHPILLPSKSHLTELIVQQTHLELRHSSYNLVLAALRTKYWLPKGRITVKRVISRCIACKRLLQRPYRLPSAPALPPERVNVSIPFHNVGLDYMGPFVLIDPANLSTTKIYVCLFSCMWSRAVALEVAPSLSTKDFLLCFRRFAAKFSLPKKIYSDNGTQFVAGHNFLESLFSEPEVTQYLKYSQIEWRFITPMSPWKGGHYERLVGVTKKVLHKSMFRKKLSVDEFRTVLAEAQTIVNSRPLTYVSSVRESEVLTPNHLLVGRNINIAPSLIEFCNDPPWQCDLSLHTQYSRLSKIIKHFQDAWNNEYILSLRERHFAATTPEQHSFPRVDDIVLLVNNSNNREDWILGKILSVETDNENIVRQVTVKTRDGTYNRSLNRIVPLELHHYDVPESENPVSPLDHPSNDPPEVETSLLDEDIPLSLPPASAPELPIINPSCGTRPKRRAAAEADSARRTLLKNNYL